MYVLWPGNHTNVKRVIETQNKTRIIHSLFDYILCIVLNNEHLHAYTLNMYLAKKIFAKFFKKALNFEINKYK